MGIRPSGMGNHSSNRSKMLRITSEITNLEIEADKFALNPESTVQKLPKQAIPPPPVTLSEVVETSQATVLNTLEAKPAEVVINTAPFYSNDAIPTTSSQAEAEIPDWVTKQPPEKPILVASKVNISVVDAAADEVLKTLRQKREDYINGRHRRT